MDDKKPESKEEKKAKFEAGAESAANNYQERAANSEIKFSDRIKDLFGAKVATKTAILGALEMAPFLAGYSMADLWVAGEGVIDLVKGVQEKDKARIFKGVVKLGGAAIPGLPVSELAPALDALLPNQEFKKTPEAQKSNEPIFNDQGAKNDNLDENGPDVNNNKI